VPPTGRAHARRQVAPKTETAPAVALQAALGRPRDPRSPRRDTRRGGETWVMLPIRASVAASGRLSSTVAEGGLALAADPPSSRIRSLGSVRSRGSPSPGQSGSPSSASPLQSAPESQAQPPSPSPSPACRSPPSPAPAPRGSSPRQPPSRTPSAAMQTRWVQVTSGSSPVPSARVDDRHLAANPCGRGGGCEPQSRSSSMIRVRAGRGRRGGCITISCGGGHSPFVPGGGGDAVKGGQALVGGQQERTWSPPGWAGSRAPAGRLPAAGRRADRRR